MFICPPFSHQHPCFALPQPASPVTLAPMFIYRILTLILLGLFLHGCSSLPAPDDDTKGWSANRIYSEAKKNLNSGDFENAISFYELLESRYPFGRYAKQGQIEVAYAYYKFDEPESAIAAADRFIKLHPNHPHVDYAYYLKGLIYYNRNVGFLGRIFKQDTSTRDPDSSRQAFNEFSALIRKFPKSRYAPEARLRALALRNSLAEHELHVASYYMSRRAYVAVVNRCKYILENFDQSSAVPEALQLMAAAYDELNLPDLANDARRVMTASFPNYTGNNKEKPWWNPF